MGVGSSRAMPFKSFFVIVVVPDFSVKYSVFTVLGFKKNKCKYDFQILSLMNIVHSSNLLWCSVFILLTV